jgi:uncharacterized OB-fold protein
VELSAALEVPPSRERRRFDRAAGRLVGSRCAECGATSWPRRAVCHSCGAPAPGEVSFEPSGTLITHTRVWVARHGLDSPYSVGQVRLADGPTIFAHVRGLPDGVKVPLEVRLAFSEDESAIPPFWFYAEEVTA